MTGRPRFDHAAFVRFACFAAAIDVAQMNFDAREFTAKPSNGALHFPSHKLVHPAVHRDVFVAVELDFQMILPKPAA